MAQNAHGFDRCSSYLSEDTLFDCAHSGTCSVDRLSANPRFEKDLAPEAMHDPRKVTKVRRLRNPMTTTHGDPQGEEGSHPTMRNRSTITSRPGG